MSNPYVQTEIIFVGNYAEIVRAKRTADGAPVIIKRLRDTALTSERIARLRHEHGILLALQRANVRGVPVPVELLESGGTFALVTRDIGGMALSTLRDTQGLSERLVLTVGMQVARALIEVHGAQVIHKDINPRNVVYNAATDEAQLIDFGLATHAERSFERDRDSLEGTLTHMAPEQTGRLGVGLDHRADLYGLGALLYDLLTGRPPVLSQDQGKMIYEILTAAPPAPRSLVPSMAPALEGVVTKLLEKDPQARYRSAYGIYRDLERCAQDLAKRGKVEDFALGQHDRSETLDWPQALQGRQAELRAMHDACQLVAAERTRVLLVAGPEGMGKTAMLTALRDDMASVHHALSTYGAYEPHRQGLGLHGLADAMTGAVRQLLMGSKEKVDVWRRRVQEALGGIGKVAVELVPALAGLVGEQPVIKHMGPTEAENRLVAILERTILAMARNNPFVLCLDNVHLADASTIRLLAQLLAPSPERRALSLVLSYDPGRVSAQSALGIWLIALQGQHDDVRQVALEPLGTQAVTSWLAAAMHIDEAGVLPLAEAVHRKTGGTPQAVRTLTQDLWQRHVLRFDTLSGSWTWDVAQVLQQPVTANLVEALKARLSDLPERCRALLGSAACIGMDFDLATMHELTGQDVAALSANLAPAMQEGILVPLDQPGHVRFTHAMVRQAAEAPLAPVVRGAFHNQVAIRMLRSQPAAASSEWICEVAAHVGVAWQAKALTLPVREAAEITYRASWRLYTSFNYPGSLACATQGVGILGDRYLEFRELWGQLRYTQLLCSLTLGEHDQARALVRGDVDRAATHEEKAFSLYRYHHVLWLSSQSEEAVEVLIDALAMMGEKVPRRPTLLTIAWALVKFRFSLAVRGRSPTSLIDAPAMSDPHYLQLWNPLRDLLLPTALVRPLLTAWVALRLARLSVLHGVQPQNASALTSLLSVAATTGRFEAAQQWANIMRGLAARANPNKQAVVRGQTAMNDGTYVEFFIIMQYESLFQNAQWVIDNYERIAQELTELGDSGTACLVYYGLTFTTLSISIDRTVVLCARLETVSAIKTNPVALLHVKAMGVGAKLMQGTLQVSGAERALMAQAAADTLVVDMARAQQCSQGILHLLMRNLKQAMECFFAAKMDRRVPETMLSRVQLMPTACVACTQIAFEHGNVMPPRVRKLFELNYKHVRLATSVKGSRYIGSRTLIQAEMAALKGRDDEASRLYELACQQSDRFAQSFNQALALEVAGRFQVRRRRHVLAGYYLIRSCRAYETWGTPYKSRELQREFGLTSSAPGDSVTTNSSSTGHASVSSHGQDLDANATMALLQSINHRLANEFKLESLAAKVMALAAEVAPECRIALVVRGTDEVLRVQSDSAPAGGTLPTFVLEEPASFSVRVVTNVNVDAAASNDPYFTGWESGFYVLVPIVHRGQMRGALYCENIDSFAYSLTTVARLDLLAGQVAVALENAAVYNTLESQVEVRTREAREVQERLNRMALNEAEIQMASGFAHEIRTAVASARFALAGLVRVDKANLANVHDDITGLLDSMDTALAGNDAAAAAAVMPALHEVMVSEKDLLENVCEGMDRAMTVTGQVLEYAEIGGVMAGDHRVALDSLLPELLSGLTADLKELHIDLSLQVPPGLLLPVREEHAFAIVRNLLANARDAVRMKGEAVGGERRIVLGAQVYKAKIDVTVADTGVGMSAESKQRVFQPFFTTKGLQGTGLGLGLSRKLARLYGGELVFESEEGKGTTFTFTLPTNDS